MKTMVVIPAYDEDGRIDGVVRGIRSAGYSDIIVVDDGSGDDTAQVARQAGAMVIHHSCNMGVGAASRTGWEAALRLGADAVVLIDADGQHDPAEIADVLAPLLCGDADITIGGRLKARSRMPVITRFFNFAGNVVTFMLSGIWLADSQSGFRALTRDAIERIEMQSSGFECCTEMVMEAARLNLRLKQVPISTIYKPEHQAKGQNYSTGLDTVFKLLVKSLMR